MRLVDCPVCGAVETVHVVWLHDSDGRDDWEYPEIDDVECGCILPADDGERILAQAYKLGPDEAI